MNMLKSIKLWSAVVLGLTLLSLAVTIYTIAGSRQGLVSYPDAFAWLVTIGQISAVLLLGALVVLGIAFKTNSSRAKLLSGIASLVLVLMVGSMVLYQVGPPPEPFMNDITTDLDDPPVFAAVIALRAESSNPIEYGGDEIAANQRLAHPEIVPIMTELSPADAFTRALEVAEGMGWNIVAEDSDSGIIEAFDTTPFFRFKDDVVIRVRAEGQGSRVDLRSHSRIGRTDLGKNAARIIQYSESY
jgi:uncharacterized protein (DUF1499 family)